MEESATMIRTQNRKVTDTILYRANNQKWHCQITWAMRFCHFWNECLSGCKIFELNYFCLFPIAIGLNSLYYAHLFWDVKCWSHVIACSPNSQMLHSICNSKKSPFRYMTCSFVGKNGKTKVFFQTLPYQIFGNNYRWLNFEILSIYGKQQERRILWVVG